MDVFSGVAELHVSSVTFTNSGTCGAFCAVLRLSDRYLFSKGEQRCVKGSAQPSLPFPFTPLAIATMGLKRTNASYYIFRVVPSGILKRRTTGLMLDTSPSATMESGAQPTAPYCICKGPAQLEALAENVKNEIFVPLPPTPGSASKSPRGLLQRSGSPWDGTGEEYLQRLCRVPGISKCASFVEFFTTNILPAETEPFWRSGCRRQVSPPFPAVPECMVDTLRLSHQGWVQKKKGDRTKLQRRFVVVKWKSLYYFEHGSFQPRFSPVRSVSHSS
jgi:hypothetical protein